jgi:hypothetical protein
MQHRWDFRERAPQWSHPRCERIAMSCFLKLVDEPICDWTSEDGCTLPFAQDEGAVLYAAPARHA